MQLPTLETITLEVRGLALVATISRPKVLNALAAQVVEDLHALLDHLEEVIAPGAWPVRGLVLTGAGEKAFVAGADIVEMSAMTPEQGRAYSRRMQDATQRLERLPVPVIAAVNGFALGGGCELALACDWVYASRTARFGQPEVNLGLVPGFGGSVRLTRRVGIAWARELILTGRMVDAETALRIGLVSELYDDGEALLAAAVSRVDGLSGTSPTAVAAAKRLLLATADAGLGEGLGLEADSFERAFRTEDKNEGVRAFLAKGKPAFPGR